VPRPDIPEDVIEELSYTPDRVTGFEAGQSLAALPPRERALVLLRAEGLNDSEIAKITGLTTMAVRLRCLRARKLAKEWRRSGQAAWVPPAWF